MGGLWQGGATDKPIVSSDESGLPLGELAVERSRRQAQRALISLRMVLDCLRILLVSASLEGLDATAWRGISAERARNRVSC